jgi:transcriptional regulator with XRE-family HTH domain
MPRRRTTYITPSTEEAIGKRLRELRKRRGLTQAVIAEQLGIDQTLVSNYERGVARLHGALVGGFARALRVSADVILGLKDSPPAAQPNGRLVRKLERIHELPPADQRAVIKYLNALLEQRQRRPRSVGRPSSDQRRGDGDR